MKLDRKGYTLIELLAVIVVVGLIIALSTYGIINAVKSSKEKTSTLSENSIKEAAETYATEKNNDNNYWLDIIDKENKYFCTTIEELMNKGLLDKKAESTKFQKSDFVLVKKNKVTFVNSKAEILTDKTSENYNICSGNIINEEITKYPKLEAGTSYTDEIHVPFTNTETNSNSIISEKICMYGDSTANMKQTATIEGNTCKLQGLKDNSIYYLRVCMTTEKGSQVCSNTESRSTVRVKKPTYTSNGNTLTINYNTSNISGEAKYYFKSTINGTSNSSATKCTLNNNIFTCNGTTTNIEKDTWYRSSNKNIGISYTTTGTVKVTARTVDKSNNYNESTNSITINKYKITFNKETADTIGGGTINITKSCYAISGQSCSIISPTIERKGYVIVGWNTNKDATKSIWNINTSKSISSSATYYPITKTYLVTIKFSTNNGILTSSTTTSGNNTYKWREQNDIIERTAANGSTYSSNFFTINYNSSTTSDGLPDYNNSKYLNITKTGYSAVSGKEWKCKSGCVTSGKTYDQAAVYKASDFCDASNGDCTVVLGINWQAKTYAITYNANGGIGAPSSQTKTYGKDLTLSSTKPTRTGYTFLGWATSSSATKAAYAAGDKYTANSGATLYAVWQAKTYTITYSANGGSGAPSSQSYTYSSSGTITLSSTKPTRAGYTFLGWSLSSSASSASYYAGQQWGRHNANNYTLYAVWKAIPVCGTNGHVWKARGIKKVPISWSNCWCGHSHTTAYIIYCSKCGMSALYYRANYGEPGSTLMCPDHPYDIGTSEVDKIVDDCSLSSYSAAKNISGGTNSFASTNKRSC